MATLEATWADALFHLLMSGGADEVIALLAAHLGRAPDFPVPLVECDLTPREALDYAVVLAEIGRDDHARELLGEVVRHAAGERPPLAPALPVPMTAVAA